MCRSALSITSPRIRFHAKSGAGPRASLFAAGPHPRRCCSAHMRLAAAQGCPRTIPTLLAVHPDEGTPRADFCRHRTESPAFADRSLPPLLIRHVEIPGRRPQTHTAGPGRKHFRKTANVFSSRGARHSLLARGPTSIAAGSRRPSRLLDACAPRNGSRLTRAYLEENGCFDLTDRLLVFNGNDSRRITR